MTSQREFLVLIRDRLDLLAGDITLNADLIDLIRAISVQILTLEQPERDFLQFLRRELETLATHIAIQTPLIDVVAMVDSRLAQLPEQIS